CQGPALTCFVLDIVPSVEKLLQPLQVFVLDREMSGRPCHGGVLRVGPCRSADVTVSRLAPPSAVRTFFTVVKGGSTTVRKVLTAGGNRMLAILRRRRCLWRLPCSPTPIPRGTGVGEAVGLASGSGWASSSWA